jgi:hypothetical protein
MDSVADRINERETRFDASDQQANFALAGAVAVFQPSAELTT